MKRILITGSRDWEDYETLYSAIQLASLKLGEDEITLVHGGAKGADNMAGIVAAKLHLNIEVYPADWDKYGKRAGFVRNAEMVKLGADICLAFIKNNSKGATMTADLAEKAGIPVFRIER